MTIKNQPEDTAGVLCESANDWFRQFLKYLEIFMTETGQDLGPDADSVDFRLAAMRAVKLTLRESGMDDDETVHLFGRIALDEKRGSEMPVWNADLNRRRFELIDADIQGKLSRAEHLELAGLTQLMREQIDSEINLPFEGAKRLHRHLAAMESRSSDAEL